MPLGRLFCDKADMAITEEIESAERRMRELSEELGGLAPESVDVDGIEARVQQLANAWGRAQMARALKRADTNAPEVEIRGSDGAIGGRTRANMGPCLGRCLSSGACISSRAVGASRCRSTFDWG